MDDGWRMLRYEWSIISLNDSICASPVIHHPSSIIHHPSSIIHSFNCATNQYNPMASLMFTTQESTIKNFFSTSTSSEFPMIVLFSYAIIIFCLSVVTYGIAVPAGIFVPCWWMMDDGWWMIDDQWWMMNGGGMTGGWWMRMLFRWLLYLISCTSLMFHPPPIIHHPPPIIHAPSSIIHPLLSIIHPPSSIIHPPSSTPQASSLAARMVVSQV